MRVRSALVTHVLSFVTVMAIPAALIAQAPARTFDDLLAGVKPGDTVWVTQVSRQEIKGRVIDLTPRTLAVTSDGRRLDINRDDVARVRLEYADPKWNGAAVGAGLALVVPLWYCSQMYESGETCGEGIKALVIIGALGAAIGAGVDARTRRRVLVYERPLGSSRLRIAPAISPRAAGMHVSLTFTP